MRDTANFGIKNAKSADTVLSALFAFLAVAFKRKTAISPQEGTFYENVLAICCNTLLTLF